VKDTHYAAAWVAGLIGIGLVGLGAWYWWTYLSSGAILRAVKAGDLARVQALIARGVDLNVGDRNGRHPLHLAARRGHADIVRALLDAGAPIDGLSDYHETALQLAARAAEPEIVDILLSHGANVHADGWGMLPIDWVAMSKSPRAAETARVLLQGGANPDGAGPERGCPLADAAFRGNREVMEVLLAYGADPNLRRGVGSPPLAWAAGRAEPEVIELLIDHGADPNVRDHYGRTPLHVAAEAGNRRVVESLLAAGADADVVDDDGVSVVDKAVAGGHEDIADILRKHGGKQEAVTVSKGPRGRMVTIRTPGPRAKSREAGQAAQGEQRHATEYIYQNP